MRNNRLFWLYLGISMLLTLCWGWEEALAVPAAPITYTLTQPNGTSFKARRVGDEWNNRTITPDGYTILKDESSGYWVYARKASGESLKLSAFKVGIDSPEGIEKGLKPEPRPIPRRRITPSAKALGQPGPPAHAPPVGTTGTQPVLVILVEFTDRALIFTDHGDWKASFFGSSSSVADYYNEVSYGALNLVPATDSYVEDDGIVAVKLPYKHPSPGDKIGDDNLQITTDALMKADPYVNFSSFDSDSNGYISTDELHLVIIVAGFEAAAGACPPGVWAHQWSLLSGVATDDGVTVGVDYVGANRYYGGYVQLGELHGISGACASADMATIGVMAHELGHDLWLPDEYDVYECDIEGIGDWGLMSGGSWNYVSLPGDSPAHPTPWDRWYENWLTPTQITGSQSVPIPAVETSATVYQLVDNPGGVDWSFYGSSGTGEYFLVENRQQTGYDVGLPACGILIWHIDESVVSSNDANASQWGRRLVALEQADGAFNLEWPPPEGGNSGDGGDPYLAGDSFDADTTPSSNLYDGSPSGVSVSVSDSCGTNMTATLGLCDLDIYYGDTDGDTYGDPNNTIQACVGSPPTGYVTNSSDCDDSIYSINPDATEACDGMDNNCDGQIDEGFPTNTYYRDGDGDTYGNPAVSIEACTIISGYVVDNTDCDDTNSAISPGASEVCDGVDNNCNGQIDEGSPTFTYYRDADGDTYGDPSVSTQACTAPAGYVSDSTDCDDTDSGANPGAAEVCDGVDNNCNGVPDDGNLADNDSDGLCDGVDPDDDNDGLPDTWELSNGLDPFDATGDNGASGDPDGDGFTNLQEYERDWDPNHASTVIYADANTANTVENGSANYPFNTITEAIGAAYSGDVITVATGTYTENVIFSGKTLVIMAEAGTEAAVINGAGVGSAVTFNNGAGPYNELNGFVIKNGSNAVGGGIAVLNGSSPLIVNNVITGNSAVYGSGIGCNASSPTIINNTIANNEGTAIGGGIYCVNASSPTVTNTILWSNGEEIYLDGSSITVTYSDVEGGYTGAGNIDADPLFVDPASVDYHLQAGSPCIDTGISSGAPVDDIDGDTRPQYSGYDMGTDEYVGAGGGGTGGGTGGAGVGGGSGGCFIATAAYGTPMAQQVRLLGQFRDQYLLTTPWGRKLVRLYYKYSPPAANYIADRDGLRLAVRVCLVPLLLVALFMVKLGLAAKLLLVGGILSLPMAWRALNNKA